MGQISYKSFTEDNRPISDHLIYVDSTGLSATTKGNMWRAFELPEPLSIYELGDFVVSFDFSLEEAGEIHGICFETNLIFANIDPPTDQENDSRRCLTTAYFQDLGNVPDITPTHYQTHVGGKHRYILNLSKIFIRLYGDQNAEPHFKNLARVSASDGLNECEGECQSDADCTGSLSCFQGNKNFVPGCDGVRDGNNEGYCYDPDYYTKEFFIRYIVFISDEDRRDSKGVRSGGESSFSNIEITTSLTSCLKGQPDFSFSLNDCTADNFLAAIKAKMESTDSCTAINKNDPLLELFAMFDATEEMDVYNDIEGICSGAYKWAGYDVYDDRTLSMDADTERQITREFLDGGSVWNYGKWDDAGAEIDTAAIRRVNSTLAGSRMLEWPNHHALDRCDVGAAMCCTASSRDFSGTDRNSEICYVDIAASRRSARVNDGYSIYNQDQTNDVYCEAFAWGTDEGSIQSALKGNALFEIGFANMLNGSVEQIPGAPLCGCLDRMPVVTNAKCTRVTSADSTVEVSFVGSLGVFDASFRLGEITKDDCGDFVGHYRDLEGGGADTPDTSFVARRIVGAEGCANATAEFLATKRLGYKTEL